MRTVALVPAYNEQSTVAETVQALTGTGRFEAVIVIDDGSNDATSDEAYKAGAEVINLQRNVGKGQALTLALRELGDAEAVALIDADTGASASEITKLLDTVENGDADMAIAILPSKPGTGGFGLVKNLASEGLEKAVKVTFQAPLSGQRVLKREVVDALGMFESGYGLEVAMTIDAIRKGFTIREVPADMRHSYTGKDLAGFLHRGRQYLDVRRALRARL